MTNLWSFLWRALHLMLRFALSFRFLLLSCCHLLWCLLHSFLAEASPSMAASALSWVHSSFTSVSWHCSHMLDTTEQFMGPRSGPDGRRNLSCSWPSSLCSSNLLSWAGGLASCWLASLWSLSCGPVMVACQQSPQTLICYWKNN